MSVRIFRKEAIEAASQIEDVQSSMRVTKSFTRIATICVALAIVAVTAWSAVVDVPIHVSGRGLFVQENGVLATTAPTAASGYVAQILVRQGQTVEKGTVLARLHMPDRESQLRKQQRELSLLKQNIRDRQKLLRSQTELKLATIRQRAAALDERLASLRAKQTWLLDRQGKLAGLQAKGIVSLEASTNARLAADAAEDAVSSAHSDRIRLEADIQTIKFGQEQTLLQDKLEIEQMQATLGAFQDALEEDAQILAASSGTLVRINTQQGTLVASGEPLFEIVPHSEGRLQAVVYVQEKDGKRLKGQDKALLTPANLPLDIHAQMIGKVIEVSALPVTTASLKHTIGDDSLIQRIVAQGPVYEVRVDLEADHKTKNGYRWTSDSAQGLDVGFGTPLSARVTTEKTPLLAMAIPALKRFFGEPSDQWAGH